MSHRTSLLIGVFLAAATLSDYFPIRNHEFVNFDDSLYVTENPLVQQGFTREGAYRAFAGPMNGFWHPLTILSHMLDVQLFGLNAGAHHLVSLLFHIANTVLLFLVLSRMTGALWRSAWVAGLFALHPLHVESVAWVSERKDVLSTLFWMLGMLGYAHYARRPSFGRYLAVLVPFILGLMAKPMLVTLPFVLLLLDYWPLKRKEKPGQLFMEKAPLLVLSAAACVLALVAQQKAGALSSWEIMPLSYRAANAVTSCAAYLLKTIWPLDLSVHYPLPVEFPEWKILASSSLLLLCTGAVAGLAGKRPYLLVGWLWFIGTLVPVIGLVQVGSHAMADRYTYIPLIGLFLMAAWVIPDTMLRFRGAVFLSGFSAAAVLLLLALQTREQAAHWKSSVTLFEHALTCTRDSSLAHSNLGSALAAEGNREGALIQYGAALRIHPGYWAPLNNIGNLLCDQRKYEEALSYYEAALKSRPDKSLLHNNLGTALVSLGRFREAISHYERALKISPDFADAMNNLGRAYEALGKIDQAIDQYRTAIKACPDKYLFHSNMGSALARKGRYDEARKSFEEAIRLGPEKASTAYNGLATLYAGERLFTRALELRRRAIRIDPENGEAHYRLAVEAYFLGEYETAKAHCTRAMDLGFKEVEPEFLRRLAAVTRQP